MEVNADMVSNSMILRKESCFYRSKPSISVGRCGIVPSKRERIDCTSRFLARLSIGGYGKELRIFSYSINEALHLSEQEER